MYLAGHGVQSLASLGQCYDTEETGCSNKGRMSWTRVSLVRPDVLNVCSFWLREPQTVTSWFLASERELAVEEEWMGVICPGVLGWCSATEMTEV